MLKAIRLAPTQIRGAVENCDTNTLPRHMLAELMKFIPTDDEVSEFLTKVRQIF